MSAVVKDRIAIPALKDPKLFRDRAYLDGAWVEADSKRRFEAIEFALKAPANDLVDNFPVAL